MRRFSLAASLALAVLVVLGLTGPVAAGEQVPFKGSLDGDVTITPLAPPFLSVLVEGTGNATQLGKFTLDIPHVVNRGMPGDSPRRFLHHLTLWNNSIPCCPRPLGSLFGGFLYAGASAARSAVPRKRITRLRPCGGSAG